MDLLNLFKENDPYRSEFKILNQNRNTPTDEEGLRKMADSLAHAYIIVDGHVDLPYRLSIKNFRPNKGVYRNSGLIQRR